MDRLRSAAARETGLFAGNIEGPAVETRCKIDDPRSAPVPRRIPAQVPVAVAVVFAPIGAVVIVERDGLYPSLCIAGSVAIGRSARHLKEIVKKNADAGCAAVEARMDGLVAL